MSKPTEVPFQSEPNHLGEIKVTTAALESIAVKAASEVPGVVVYQESTQRQIGNLLGIYNDVLEAKVRYEAPHINIAVKIGVQFGYSVPEVAFQVQERVKEQILFMTDISIYQVDVHVVSVETEPAYDEAPYEYEYEDGEA